MRRLLKDTFRSQNFVIGFIIFAGLVLTITIYPRVNSAEPLDSIGQGTFFPPGIYVNVYDSASSDPYTLDLPGAEDGRVGSRLSAADRQAMKDWLVAAGVMESLINIEDTQALLTLWDASFDSSTRLPGMTNADRNYYLRLDASLVDLLSTEPEIVASVNPETGELEETGEISPSDYVNVGEVANTKVLLLGTDNFGRDVLTELIHAAAVSLRIGFVAGIVATFIGLLLGLISGYIGGFVDDAIMLVTNLFTVIPPFVLLILISFSLGQENRGATTVAIVIGVTSWVWTARAVRSQVISLRNRDHVNLSKLSGHSIGYIIFRDILPYIASYVVMAFILQLAAGILAEAQLSILGLGPRTTDVPTLGLMMRWAMTYQAHILGKWWAYLPVIITIALITFSMNLMNTGLDRVFNPALRD